MMWAAGWALVAAVMIAATAPRLSRQLPPATATVLLVGSAVTSVAGCAYVFSMLAFTWVAQIPEVAAKGDWSPLLLHQANPVPAAVAMLGGVALVVASTAVLRSGIRRARSHWRLRQLVKPLAHSDGLLIVKSEQPDAYATPAAGGRIVITTGMLAALEPGEERALLAHERAHLRLRHGWWLTVVELAAVANPMLRPTAVAVAESVERWADERAAVAVADRRLVARALARAALHVHGHHVHTVMPMVGGQTPRRVHALLEPPPQRRITPVLVLLVLVAAVTAATVNVGARTDYVLDGAAVSSRTTLPHGSGRPADTMRVTGSAQSH